MPQGQVTIERLCRVARVSRAGYYRFWQTSAPRQHDTAARDTIQRLVLANGRYRRGYRYITQQLPTRPAARWQRGIHASRPSRPMSPAERA